MTSLDQLPTPSLLLDKTRLQANCQRMGQRLKSLGVALRPHVKTAKSAPVAELCVADHPRAITVSTLKEAEYFLASGFDDILYGVCITPDKLPRIAGLQARGAKITVITDSEPVAGELAGFNMPKPLPVLIEIDSGEHRSGQPADGEELLTIATILNRGTNTDLTGIMTHAGHSYHCTSTADIIQVAQQERDVVKFAASRLRQQGLPCPVVSIGSTPTAHCIDELTGITEVRAGVYVFYDLHQRTLGVCRQEDLALSVLSTVIGHNRQSGHLIIDAGGLALSKDLSTQSQRPEIGLGEVADLHSGQSHPGLYVARVYQEHGIIPASDNQWFTALPIGARVRIYPNHACMTAAAYDSYQVIEDNQVIDVWNRVNGW